MLIPIATFTNWVAASIITILFPILKESLGTPSYLFFFYALFCCVQFVIVYKYLIETKDKSEPQIYREYEKRD